MTSVLTTLGPVLSAIIPVFLVVGLGYLVRRRFALDARTLATLNIYVFIPALIFGNLSRRAIEWSLFGRCALAMAVLVAAMTALLTTVARVRRMEPDLKSAFVMTLFTNLGNFGLPVVAFAFGKTEGLPLAVVVMVCGSFLQNSVGIYFAQRSRHTAARALVRVLRFPMIYAFALSLLFQRMHWGLPEAVARAVDITADAAIPVQLMVLGLKLAETRLDTGFDVFLACFFRLCAGPVVAFAAARLAGLEDLALKVFVLQLSGPVAVGMAVYGVQFNIRPGFLASVVSWTFLLSSVTVGAVLAILYRI